MGESAFTLQHDFQALRLNESNHASIASFAFFQNFGFQLRESYEEALPAISLDRYVAGLSFGETVAKNRPPMATFEARPKFKQRTFAGKPLSDDEIAKANRLAGELGDETPLRQLLGR
jgi:hypothetical protein